jgi:hypothetical protein
MRARQKIKTQRKLFIEQIHSNFFEKDTCISEPIIYVNAYAESSSRSYAPPPYSTCKHNDPAVKQLGKQRLKHDQKNRPSALDFGEARFRTVQCETKTSGVLIIFILKLKELATGAKHFG